MLSIEEYKKRLADKTLSDQEVEQLRDDLYRKANLAVDMYFDIKKRGLLDQKGGLR